VRSFKTTIRVCLAVICALCLVMNVAMAAPFTANAVYNADSGVIDVTGTGNENAKVTVMVMPFETDASAITDSVVNAGNVVFSMGDVDVNGEFDIEAALKNSWGGGLYKAIVTVGNDSSEVCFSYADGEKIAENLTTLNTGDSAAIKALISSKGKDIGISDEHAEAYAEKIVAYILSERPEGGYSEDTYLETLTAAVAISMVQGGEITLSEAVNSFAGYMDIDVKTEYDVYSKEVIAAAGELLAEGKIASGSAKEMYMEAVTVAGINLAETDSAMQLIVVGNSDSLGLDLTAYNSLSNDYKKLLVFAALLNTDFESAKDFSDDFNLSVATVKANDNGPQYIGGGNGGSTGSGSGGGFGGGGSTVANTPVPVVPSYFNDMSGHWGATAVNTLVSKGVIGGYPDGTFKPENNVTRAEYAKMLCSALNIPVSGYSAVYSDVKSGDWFAPYVIALSNKGIITGFDGKFNPDGKITRQDAAVMTYRAAKAMLASGDAYVVFNDEAKIADYAKEAVKKLASLKVINGYDGKFDPTNNTTRAQAATIICNVLSACGIK